MLLSRGPGDAELSVSSRYWSLPGIEKTPSLKIERSGPPAPPQGVHGVPPSARIASAPLTSISAATGPFVIVIVIGSE
ncbi:MAG: hypothetical protein ACLP01_02210 [Solirubrobacteraceae bacterium]